MPPPSETPRRELTALMLLTFVTGLVDAASFLRLGHVFTANMTGNVVFLGFAAGGGAGLSAWRSITSIAAFLCGAIAGGCWSSRMSRGSRGRWLGAAAAAEAILILIAAASASQAYAVIVLTALAMGLRNATVRSMGVADMTTTVLTLTLTGLASDSSLAGGTNPRVGRRIGSIAFMFAGALAGTLLLNWGIAATLAAGAIVSGSAAACFLRVR